MVPPKDGKYGVHSAMPTAQAARLCPELVLLPPDFKRYTQASREIMEIFKRYTPLVEPLSLDEAFLDVAGCERLHGDAEVIGREIKAAILNLEKEDNAEEEEERDEFYNGDEADAADEVGGDHEAEERPRAEAADDDRARLRKVAQDVARKLHHHGDDHPAEGVRQDRRPHHPVEAVEHLYVAATGEASHRCAENCARIAPPELRRPNCAARNCAARIARRRRLRCRPRA